jgi:MFS family permease
LSERHHGSALSEWQENWSVVLAAMAGMSLMSIYVSSNGVMIGPLEKEFGWSRTQISSGPVAIGIAGFVLSPLIGLAVDRFGSRKIGLLGIILVCTALGLLSVTNANIWSWRGLWALLAIAGTFISATVWAAAVAKYFFLGRGVALATALCGIGVGTALVPPLTHYLVESYGWRMAYVGLGAISALITLPLVYCFLKDNTSEKPLDQTVGDSSVAGGPVQLGEVSLRESLLSVTFVKILVGAFAVSFAGVALILNSVPILIFTGHSAGTAATIASVIGIASIVGRLSGGFLLDRFRGNLVAGFFVCLPIVTCALLITMPGSVPVATLAVFLVGLSLGVELDAVAYLSSRYFGLRNFGVLFGTLSGFIAVASSTGPLVANFIYDQTGSYYPFIWACIPLAIASSLSFLSLGPYPDSADGDLHAGSSP